MVLEVGSAVAVRRGSHGPLLSGILKERDGEVCVFPPEVEPGSRHIRPTPLTNFQAVLACGNRVLTRYKKEQYLMPATIQQYGRSLYVVEDKETAKLGGRDFVQRQKVHVFRGREKDARVHLSAAGNPVRLSQSSPLSPFSTPRSTTSRKSRRAALAAAVIS